MHTVSVTLRSRDTDAPAFETLGLAPTPDSPLVLVGRWFYDFAKQTWRQSETSEHTSWYIVHKPTGFNLGHRCWQTQPEAMAVLLACDPAFLGWQFANGAGADGKLSDPATIACHQKFKVAVGI